jgi:hypothetical protein
MSGRKLQANDAVTFAELDNEAVLLNVETGMYFGLDAFGTQIWQLLAEGMSEDMITDRLLADYDVEPSRLRSDVATFLELLQEKGLVRETAT